MFNGSFQRNGKHLLVLQISLKHLPLNPTSTQHKHHLHFYNPSKYFRWQHLSSIKDCGGFLTNDIVAFRNVPGSNKLGIFRPVKTTRTRGQNWCRLLVAKTKWTARLRAAGRIASKRLITIRTAHLATVHC